jgi:hypothetical protein
MMPRDTIKLFVCDFNFSMVGDSPRPSLPQDWANVDPEEYYNWHLEFGDNAIFCHAYAFGGYAFYPTRLGPVAPEPGNMLLPSLYEISRERGVPFWSYFCVGADHVMMALRGNWKVPGTYFMAPESPWTDLLCDRIREFLSMYPVDWILFDWFVYGSLDKEGAPIGSSPYSSERYSEIMDKALPEDPSAISREDDIAYKREVLRRQFQEIHRAVKETSASTKIAFNVPYQEPSGAIWTDHPMLRESEGLFSECTDDAIMEWLLSIKEPGQRLMTTVRGGAGEGLKGDPRHWRKWYDRGCDFMGYAFGTPPDFRPHQVFQEDVELVRQAFAQMD